MVDYARSSHAQPRTSCTGYCFLRKCWPTWLRKTSPLQDAVASGFSRGSAQSHVTAPGLHRHDTDTNISSSLEQTRSSASCIQLSSAGGIIEIRPHMRCICWPHPVCCGCNARYWHATQQHKRIVSMLTMSGPTIATPFPAAV